MTKENLSREAAETVLNSVSHYPSVRMMNDGGRTAVARIIKRAITRALEARDAEWQKKFNDKHCPTCDDEACGQV